MLLLIDEMNISISPDKINLQINKINYSKDFREDFAKFCSEVITERKIEKAKIFKVKKAKEEK